MNKKIKISICIFISILLVGGIFSYYFCNKPERIVEKYINSMSNRNCTELSKCRTKDYGNLEEGGLDYIDYVELIGIEAVTDYKSIEDAYLHRIEAKPQYQHYPKKDFKLFDVTYYLKTKDKFTSPINSDTYTKSFLVLKENGKWKIASIEATKRGFEESFKEGNYYNKQTQDYKHLNKILDKVTLNDGMKLLDLGTGSGYLAFEAAKRNRNVYIIVYSEKVEI